MAGRKPFTPTAEDRKLVSSLAGYGAPHEYIASCVLNPQTGKPMTAKTLRMHFRTELDTAVAQANALVAESLFKKARGNGQGAVVAERKAARTKPPQLYQVVMLNDDYTPMEFVVMVLQQYFQRDPDTATLIMLKIHHEGRGICGVYTKDIAATKVELVLTAARREGHPLQCIMEAA